MRAMGKTLAAALIGLLVTAGCSPESPTAALRPQGSAAELGPESSRAELLGFEGTSGRGGGESSPAQAQAKIPMDPPGIGLPVVHGRVVDARTGRGVADRKLRLSLTGGQHQETLSGPDGSFRFRPVARFYTAGLWLHAQQGSRVIGVERMRSLSLDRAQRVGEAEVLVEVAELQSGLVNGRAVDSAGEAIAGLSFSLTTAGPVTGRDSQTVTTDELGAFQTHGPLRGGTLSVRVESGDARYVGGARDLLIGDEEPFVLRFERASLMRFSLGGELPADLSELRVWLLDPEQETPFFIASVLPGAEPDQASIRLPWMRRVPEPGDNLLLAVGDVPGFLFGVQGYTWGEEPEVPLHFDLEATGVLRPKLTYAGQPEDPRMVVFSGLDFHHELESEGEPPPAWAWRSQRLYALPPGSYTLRSWTREHGEVISKASVTAGVITEVPIHLPYDRGGRTVRVTVASDDGEPLRMDGLDLSLKGDPTRSWNIIDSRGLFCGTGLDRTFEVDDKGLHMTHTLEHVPAGDLLVEPEGRSAVRVTVHGEPDGDQLVEIREYELEQGFGIRAKLRDFPSVDAYFTCKYRVLDGGPGFPNHFRSGSIFAEGSPATRRFEWAVEARGMRTVYGDQRSFTDEGEGRWFADAELVEGWTTRLQAFDGQGNAVAGAEVLFDEEVRGITDSEGWFEVPPGHFEAPGEILLRHSERQLASEPVPRYRMGLPWIDVELLGPEDR